MVVKKVKATKTIKSVSSAAKKRTTDDSQNPIGTYHEAFAINEGLAKFLNLSVKIQTDAPQTKKSLARTIKSCDIQHEIAERRAESLVVSGIDNG